jgi:hypothetical protein
LAEDVKCITVGVVVVVDVVDVDDGREYEGQVKA